MIKIVGKPFRARLNGKKTQLHIPTTDGLFTVADLCAHVKRTYQIDLTENTLRTRLCRYPWHSSIMLSPPNKGGYSDELRKLREAGTIPPAPPSEDDMQEGPWKIKYPEGCFAHLPDKSRTKSFKPWGTWEREYYHREAEHAE